MDSVPTIVELAIATALQIGALIWTVSAVRSDIHNLSGWVKSIDARGAETSNLAAELKGQLAMMMGTCSKHQGD